MSNSISCSAAQVVAGRPARRRVARRSAFALALVALALSAAATAASAASAPEIEKLSRSNGPVTGGQKVKIAGTNFTGATAVDFGTTEASFTVVSSKHIQATAPAGVGTVDVTVTTAAGTSATHASDRYEYESRPPAVTKLSLSKGPAAGGTTVTISGEHFAAVSAVDFGAFAASSFTVSSEGSITAVSPQQSVGRVDVKVTTLYGVSASEYCGKFGGRPCTVHDSFKYLEPTLTSISPGGGPIAGGTPVTITGTGFTLGTSGTTFLFGKSPASDVECQSDTECTALTPAARKAGTVAVKANVIGDEAHASTNKEADLEFAFSG